MSIWSRKIQQAHCHTRAHNPWDIEPPFPCWIVYFPRVWGWLWQRNIESFSIVRKVRQHEKSVPSHLKHLQNINVGTRVFRDTFLHKVVDLEKKAPLGRTGADVKSVCTAHVPYASATRLSKDETHNNTCNGTLLLFPDTYTGFIIQKHFSQNRFLRCRMNVAREKINAFPLGTLAERLMLVLYQLINLSHFLMKDLTESAVGKEIRAAYFAASFV